MEVFLCHGQPTVAGEKTRTITITTDGFVYIEIFNVKIGSSNPEVLETETNAKGIKKNTQESAVSFHPSKSVIYAPHGGRVRSRTTKVNILQPAIDTLTNRSCLAALSAVKQLGFGVARADGVNQ